MISMGLVEMFKDDFADMCGEKFPLVPIGGRVEGKCAETRERGPPLAPAEISLVHFQFRLPAKAPPSQT